MQLKACTLAAIVAAASSVSATPIENQGLVQKHVVVQHNNQICISTQKVDACATNTRANGYRKINMPVVCREQFSDEIVRQAQEGKKIEEVYQATATDFVQRQVPRACIDEQEEGSEQQQQFQRRSQWQPIRGAHANKHMITEDDSASEQYLKLKLARFTQNQIPQFKAQYEQYKEQKSNVEGQDKNEWESEQTNVSEQINSTWKNLSLHRMMQMSEKEHQKINQQLRMLLAKKPEVAGWLFQYETELPMIYTKLAQTLREFMLQPYWTENEQVSQMLSHQYNTAANRIWTYLVKEVIVEREQQLIKSEQTTVPELETLVKKIWSAAVSELHQTQEVEVAERNYNKFIQQLKEQKPEQYKSMFKIFTQFNLGQEESRNIAKHLLQLIISSFQVSNPEHSQEYTSEEAQYHQQPIWNPEQLQTAEQTLREAVQKDWSQFQRHFQNQHQQQNSNNKNSEQDQEYENSEDAEQQWTDKQAANQQEGALRGVFGKLKVAFQRFEQTIRGQRVNAYNNNNQQQ